MTEVVSTFAISLQLCPASRICFSRCSSCGVHGVLVRPRFFPVSSLRRAGIETLAALEVMVVVVAAAVAALLSGTTGRVVPGGNVSSLGLWDVLRFRALGDDARGGAGSSRVLEASGTGGTGPSVVGVVGDVNEGDDAFCRFAGGGDLVVSGRYSSRERRRSSGRT